MLEKKFNRLTVISREGSKNGNKLWKCLCDCGNTTYATTNILRKGYKKSCGCLSKETTSEYCTTHGLTKTPIGLKIYGAWKNIKSRCYLRSNPRFKNYGARGIAIQESWKDDVTSFFDYVYKLEGFSIEKSIDRIDNDGDYCEGNLRWATASQQERNKGKGVTNSSGACGVYWAKDSKGVTMSLAKWQQADGKMASRSFSVNKYGLLPAFKLAVDYRNKMIHELNAQGAGYSYKHGK